MTDSPRVWLSKLPEYYNEWIPPKHEAWLIVIPKKLWSLKQWKRAFQIKEFIENE